MTGEEISEATSLIDSAPTPKYAFESSITRKRKRRVRQFQCCVCSIFLGVIIVAVVISVGFNLNNIPYDDNTTDVNISEIFLELYRNIPLDSHSFDQLSDESVMSLNNYEEALNAGEKALEGREKIEEITPELDKMSPSYKHQKVVATTEKGRQLSRIGYAEEYATKYLAKTSKNYTGTCFKGTNNTLFLKACKEVKLSCNIYQKFRTYDGSCNNLKYLHGVSYTPFRRILAPNYADGISSPRVAKSGKPLPSAKLVSNVVHRPIYRDDPKFTIMLAVFGQFLDHDITATALNQGTGGKSISCCSEGIIKHPECFPVELSNFGNTTCMEFVRSAAAPTCCFGPRQQLNQASAYIDGSVIYGSDETTVNKLREFTDGKLKMLVVDNVTLLPISNDPDDGCNREEENRKGRYCFMSGDSRANENLHLTSMHLIWAKQHNLLASELLKLNPNWDDERVFQESRRILIAQLQHVTYNEFLPIVLGEYSERFNLKSLDEGYFRNYNASLDASIANGFAASAFRFAHTLIPSLIKMIGNDNTNPEIIQLHKMLFDPFQLYKKGVLERVMSGAMHTSIQASDAYFTPELKEHMFRQPATPDNMNNSKLCGLDLVSLNIQRGRDHGLPGYTSWRAHCGLPRPHTFDQLTRDIDGDSLQYIRSIYSDVDDIDFYTGAVSEKPLEGGFLGPTITCILLDQFARLKMGDRFYYENNGRQSFNLNQLNEIRKTSLARIICDNAQEIHSVQPLIMKRIDADNVPIDCRNLSRMNFNPWKENFISVSVPNTGVSPRIN